MLRKSKSFNLCAISHTGFSSLHFKSTSVIFVTEVEFANHWIFISNSFLRSAMVAVEYSFRLSFSLIAPHPP